MRCRRAGGSKLAGGDEAAAIPRRCCCNTDTAFPRILLTTAVQGLRRRTRFYLSFAPVFTQLHASRFISLSAGRRMPAGKYRRALIFDDEAFAQAPHGAIAISAFYQQRAGGRRPCCRGCVNYCRGALSYFAVGSAPNDGCAGRHFLQATANNRVAAGALWLVERAGYPQNSVRLAIRAVSGVRVEIW